MLKSWREINAIYQIYPRSFKDSNGDGIGDLPGIILGLDYVATAVGAEAIWLSPFYLSPQADCGYDVSDHCAVDPLFGTLEDFDRLLSASHEKGLKVMLDLVPNHTADEHIWFKEARSSRDNPKRDWYVWRDEPNNWRSISGGSSWTFDEVTGQYYLHSFMSSQPDLNWENPEVREAMKEVMRFWFNRGVDGFRVDAVWALSKDPNFSDDPINTSYDGADGEFGSFIHSACKNGPKLEEYLREITSVATEYTDKYVLFEFYPDSMLGDENDQLKLLHEISPEHASPFYFEGLHKPWHATGFGKALTAYLGVVPANGRPSFTFSNHDQPRLVSRYGEEKARLIAFMQMTLPGLPVMYYGDELGMENVDIPPELTKDKFEKTGDSGGRDPGRTPMQWSNTEFGGFSNTTPWLPVHGNIANRNTYDEVRDIDSWLHMYRRLLEKRRELLLREGTFKVIDCDSGYVLGYERTYNGETLYVACNFASASQIITLPAPIKETLLSTHLGAVTIRNDGRVILPGFSAALMLGESQTDS